jgi:1-acyl-sn-glycerol-3-phosphate acyltransferase
MNPIPINRKNKIQSLKKVLKHASARLKNNYSVLIFPEGTRVSPELGISSFGNSCGLLSVNNNIPILPICHNSGKYWQNKKFIKKAGVIKVSIGPLFKGDDPKELTREVQLWMQNEYKKMF